jgi:hypothetical protein
MEITISPKGMQELMEQGIKNVENGDYLFNSISYTEQFLRTGVYRGFNFPVTTEDPDLLVLESIPTEGKKWGIGFFVGEPTAKNCIGLINDDTDFTILSRYILTTAVVTRDGKLIGSVGNRIDKRRDNLFKIQ